MTVILDRKEQQCCPPLPGTATSLAWLGVLAQNGGGPSLVLPPLALWFRGVRLHHGKLCFVLSLDATLWRRRWKAEVAGAQDIAALRAEIALLRRDRGYFDPLG
jgi:hypothetical protein